VESLFRDSTESEADGREIFAREVDKALEMIGLFQKRFPRRIKVRLTKETPSVTVMMTDRSEATVSLNLYRVYPTQRPALVLSKSKHPAWFSLFEERYYTELWSTASP